MISSTPSEVRFLSPPDIVLCMMLPILVFATSSLSPNEFNNYWTLRSYSFFGTSNFNLAAKVMASYGVKNENSASSYII